MILWQIVMSDTQKGDLLVNLILIIQTHYVTIYTSYTIYCVSKVYLAKVLIQDENIDYDKVSLKVYLENM